MDIPRTPSMMDVVKAAIDKRQLEVHTCLVGSVEAYYPDKQMVDVSPQLRQTLFDSDGNEVEESFPVIPNVPVAWPSAGGFRITFPIVKGDTCVLWFCERSLDEWLENGGVVTPIDPRVHDLTDAIAFFGINPKSKAATGASSEGITLGKDGGTQIAVKDGSIELGDSPGEYVALGQAIQTFLSGFVSVFNSHTHASAAPGSPTSTPVAPQTSPGTLKSATVKVKT